MADVEAQPEPQYQQQQQQHHAHERTVSHGRGGAGNMGVDDVKYVDAGIVRAGPEGDQGDGAWSAGRGGAGNIGAAFETPAHAPHDVDIVPQVDVRLPERGSYHTGRGGLGNAHVDPDDAQRDGSKPAVVGLADRLKNLLFGLWRK